MTEAHQRYRIGELFQETVARFRSCSFEFLTYELIFKIVSFFVIAPVYALVGAYFISFTGHSSVSNEQLVSYVLSVPGMASIFVAGVSYVAVLYTEIAGLSIIASASFAGGAIGVSRALVMAARNLPALVGTATIQFLVYVLCLLPCAGLAWMTYSNLIAKQDINYYLAHVPPEFILAIAIGCLLIAVISLVWFALLTAWVFTVPACVFEGKNLLGALRQSRELVKGSFRRIAVVLLVAVVSFFALSSIVILLITGVAGTAAQALGAVVNAPVPLAAMVIVVNTMVVALLSVIGLPLLSIVLTRLYREQHQDKGLEIPDRVFHTGEPSAAVAGGTSTKLFTWILIGSFVVATGVVSISLYNDLEREDDVKVTAHRGSSKKAPENTLSAVRQAIADGADYAEIDVQLTSDRVAVLLHDSDLMKVAGVNKKIWETTYDEIKSLDAGSWFSPEFKGERIPMLEEVIDLARGKIKLNIELKYDGKDPKLADRVVEIVRNKGFGDQCIITSLSYEGLLDVKKLNPRLRTGYILVKGIGDVLGLDVDLFSVQSSIATSRFTASAHKRDKQVHVWTINDPRQMDYFIDLQVDNIITDHPKVLIEILEKRSTMSYSDRVLHRLKNWLR